MKFEEYLSVLCAPGTTFEVGALGLDEFAENWRRQSSGVTRPLFDKIVIEPIEGEIALGNGLVLPESAREKPMKGLVVAVGPGKGGVAPLEVGDVVLYAKHAGVEVTLEGKDLLLMSQTDIFAVI